MTASGRSGAQVRIRFEPMGLEGAWHRDETLFKCARRLGVRVASSCGAKGTCTTCAIQVVEGAVATSAGDDARYFSGQEIAEGWTRSCQTYAKGDAVVVVPPRSLAEPARHDVGGPETEVAVDPLVRSFTLALPAPTLSDGRADGDRLRDGLNALKSGLCNRFDVEVLRTLPATLRREDWRIGASLRTRELIAVGPAERPGLGLAIDLGTTNISGQLVDLERGKTLATQGIENPQKEHGADLIARIGFARRSADNARLMRQGVVDAINFMTERLCHDAEVDHDRILDLVVAGNTVMQHLLLELPVHDLGMSPFVPVVREGLDVKARELGLRTAAGAYVHLLPNIAGFIGGDHTGVLVAAAELIGDGPVLALDIGTNTEVSLVEGGTITSVSCPSGPAFEGGHLSCGMAAASGAIERVRIEGAGVELGTIEDAPPVGICGSGVMDAVAQMVTAGAVNARGRLEADHPRVRSREHARAFVLADERDGADRAILFRQEDVRAVQLAKAAIRAGIDLLIEESGHAPDDIARVIVAGAFGSYIDIKSALTIGLLPPLPTDRFTKVGNAAASGARMALLSKRCRVRARDVAARARYLELATLTSFTRRFAKRINFDAAGAAAARAATHDATL
jgi:uncharacterized 2Fe-2S/4Fe-4S cluster protein (DUF4445 family)